MNDFELNYLHYARSEELIKQAEHERQARELVRAAKATRRAGGNVRHEGLAARVAKALGRGERTGESAGGRGSARVQPAK
jgi:ParB-like chromosome segregation protein Spo0J